MSNKFISVFLLPPNTQVTLGKGWENIQELCTYVTKCNIKFENDNKVYNYHEILRQRHRETRAQYLSRLHTKGIKIISGEVWNDEDDRFYDKNDYVLELRDDGSYQKTYPNKTQKANYNDLVTKQQEELVAKLENDKISLIEKSKDECSRRIQTINNKQYSDISWLRKSQNYQDIRSRYLSKLASGVNPTQSEIELYNEVSGILDRKDRYVVRQNEIETNILAFTTREQIDSFDITDDTHWVGCD